MNTQKNIENKIIDEEIKKLQIIRDNLKKYRDSLKKKKIKELEGE